MPTHAPALISSSRRADSTERQVVAAMSDSHGGSALALLNPDTVLADPKNFDSLQEKPVHLNAFQERLWEWFSDDVARVLALADGCPLTVLHLGDPTQGTRFASELVSTRIADHIIIAADNMGPWFEYPALKACRMIVGTGVHEFNEATSSILVARELKTRFPNVDTRPVYHNLPDIGGRTFDLAHHGAFPGSRNWLRGNVLRSYVRDIMQNDIADGKRPPDFVLRGHYHTYVPEVVHERDHETFAAILPSWCWPTEHARKATQSVSRVTFGVWAVVLEQGRRPEWTIFKRTIDFRTRETL